MPFCGVLVTYGSSNRRGKFTSNHSDIKIFLRRFRPAMAASNTGTILSCNAKAKLI